MPIPFAAAAVPLGAKILGGATTLLKGAIPFAKGITGLGGAVKGGATALGALGKGQAARTAVQRFAGDAMAKAGGLVGNGGGKQLSLNLGDAAKASVNMADDAGMIDKIRRGLTSREGFAKNLGMPLTKGEILASAAPDIFFGGMAAMQTEGDLIDKAIAGTGAAAGGALGGLGLRGVLGPKSNLGIIASEMGGSMVGDMVGYGAADNIIRMKNGGMTPAEQGYAAQDEQYRQQLMAELKQQYGV